MKPVEIEIQDQKEILDDEEGLSISDLSIDNNHQTEVIVIQDRKLTKSQQEWTEQLLKQEPQQLTAGTKSVLVYIEDLHMS
jgi:hypothetical protein